MTERTKGPAVSMRRPPTRGPQDPWTPRKIALRGHPCRLLPRRPTVDGPAHDVHLHSPYIAVFMQRCGSIYVLGGSLTLRYRDKGNLLINGRHRKDYRDAPCAAPRLRWGAAATTSVKAMEMHQGPRPVYGGPGLMGVNIWTQTKSHGGSRGPLDPWSASTASKRWDLWFFRSRKNNDNSICCKKDGRQLTPITNLQDKPR